MGKHEGTVIDEPLGLLTDGTNVYIGRKQSVFEKHREKAGLYIGKVAERERTGLDMYDKTILLDSISPHAIFICGMRGSGKSYTLGVIAEEMASKNKGAGVIIIDPMGIFWSMKKGNKIAQEKNFLKRWGLSAKGFSNVQVFLPAGFIDESPKDTYDKKFSLRPSEISVEEWCLTFNIDRFDTMGLLLDRVVSCVRDGYTTVDDTEVPGRGDDYNIVDLVDCIIQEETINSAAQGFKQTTRRALIARLSGADEWGIFDKEGTKLGDLSKRGIVSVIDVSFLGDNVRALVVGIIARNLLNTRKMVSRHEATGNLKNIFGSIPVTWLLIDEAHILVPASGQKTAATDSIIEYVRQGRQPGCSLVLATQQPSAIDSRVLSQTDILICHKLVYDDDIKAVIRRMPSEMPAMYKDARFIKSLPIGMTLIGDKQEQTSRAFLAQIRPRISQHEGRERTATLDIDPEIIKQNIKLLIEEQYGTEDEEAIIGLITSIGEDYGINIDPIEILNELAAEERIDREIDPLLASLQEEATVEEAQVTVDEIEEHDAPAPSLSEEMPFAPDPPQDDLPQPEAMPVEPDAINLYEIEVEDVVEVDGPPPEHTFAPAETCDIVPVEPEISLTDIEMVPYGGEGLTSRPVNIEYSRERVVIEHIGVDAIDDIADKRRKKKLFGSKENIICHYLVYYPLWEVVFDYFPKKKQYASLAAYVDGITCEIVRKGKGLVRTKGVRELIDLKDAEQEVLRYLQKREHATMEDVQKDLHVTPKKASALIDELHEKRLVSFKHAGQHTEILVSFDFDLIKSPLDKSISKVALDVNEEYVESESLIECVVSEKQARRAVELFNDTQIWKVEKTYYPYWVVIYDNGERKRAVLFDAVSGTVDSYACRMLRFRI
jgi:predicted transcriptional regulator